jgi:hypothetical protein
LLKADFRPLEDEFDIYQCLNNASVITPLHSTEVRSGIAFSTFEGMEDVERDVFDTLDL